MGEWKVYRERSDWVLGSTWNIYGYLSSRAIIEVDPMGCTIFHWIELVHRVARVHRRSRSWFASMTLLGTSAAVTRRKSSIPIVQV